MDMLNSYPVTSQQIKIWTDHDPVLSKVRDSVLKGRQDSTDENLKMHQQRQLELGIHDSCLFWGNQVIMPGRF
jgi:hypothetical protein